jgi:hypothetical protein
LAQPASVILSSRPFAQVLSDFSFQTAALSMPANPGHDDLDEQKPGDDGQSKEQIKELFGHRLLRFSSTIEQCRDRYEIEGKLRGLGTGFLKSPSLADAGMPQCYG